MPKGGLSEEVEQEVGQAEGKLITHRAAFARTSVIQAFLGSAPQLTLQLYICVLQQGVSIGRGTSRPIMSRHVHHLSYIYIYDNVFIGGFFPKVTKLMEKFAIFFNVCF